MTTQTTEPQIKHKSETQEPKREKGCAQRAISITLTSLIAIAIVAGGAFIAYELYITKPTAKKRQKPRMQTVVEVASLQRQDFTVTVEAFGNIEPARTIDVQPRVTGAITAISDQLIPGNFIPKGHLIARIESDDYQIIKTQREADLMKANANHQVEVGRQSVAEREFNLIAKTSELSEEDKALILRKPQLQIAEANILTSQNALDRAELDLKRTTITAPFNATINTKYTDLGALVSPQSRIVSLVGTDQYWLRLLVNARDLKWISADKAGQQSATITNDHAWQDLPIKKRTASVSQIIPELETNGRLVQVLLTINDPLTLQPENKNLPQALIGMYVRARLTGPTLKDVFVIPRKAVHDNNTIWIMTPDNQLEIRTIIPVCEDNDFVVTRTGVKPNERLVTTGIAAPTNGQPLKLAGQPAKPSQQKNKPGNTNRQSKPNASRKAP